MVVEFPAPAHAELAEAIAYYDSQERGLGSQFAEEVKRTLERILQSLKPGQQFRAGLAAVEPTSSPTASFIRFTVKLYLWSRSCTFTVNREHGKASSAR